MCRDHWLSVLRPKDCPWVSSAAHQLTATVAQLGYLIVWYSHIECVVGGWEWTRFHRARDESVNSISLISTQYAPRCDSIHSRRRKVEGGRIQQWLSQLSEMIGKPAKIRCGICKDLSITCISPYISPIARSWKCLSYRALSSLLLPASLSGCGSFCEGRRLILMRGWGLMKNPVGVQIRLVGRIWSQDRHLLKFVFVIVDKPDANEKKMQHRTDGKLDEALWSG